METMSQCWIQIGQSRRSLMIIPPLSMIRMISFSLPRVKDLIIKLSSLKSINKSQIRILSNIKNRTLTLSWDRLQNTMLMSTLLVMHSILRMRSLRNLLMKLLSKLKWRSFRIWLIIDYRREIIWWVWISAEFFLWIKWLMVVQYLLKYLAISKMEFWSLIQDCLICMKK